MFGWTANRDMFEARIYASPAAIAPLWQELYAQGAATVFQSYAWAEAWYRAAALKGSVTPVVVTLHDRDSRPALIAALAIVREGGKQVLTFADEGVSDYNAPLLGPAAPRTAQEAAAAWRAIRQILPAADLMRFVKMPAEIGGRPNPFALMAGTTPGALHAYACAVTAPYAETRKALISEKLRSEIDAKLRRLSKQCEMKLVAAKGRDERLAIFEALVQQKRARAAKMGWSDNILDDPVWQGFYRDIVTDPDGIAEVLALTTDGHPAAIIIGFRKDNHFCDCLTSFDMTMFKNCSLGLLALDKAMEWAAENGVTVYDLTIGAEAYKANYTPKEQVLFENIQAFSVAGAGAALKAQVKNYVRSQPWLYVPARLGRELIAPMRG